MKEDLPPEFEDIYFIFKLISGDTIICQVLQDTEKTVVVRDPLLIHDLIVEKENGGKNGYIYFSEWFVGVENRCHMVRKDHILSVGIPNKSIRDEYTASVKRKVNQTVESSSTPQKPATQSKDWTGLDFDIKTKNRFGKN